MLKAAVSMPGSVYQQIAEEALRRTGDFDIVMLPHGEPADIAEACVACGADLLLMLVSVVSGFNAGQRGETAAIVREKLPDCKIVVLVDDDVSETQTAGVKSMKQARLIDGFVYSSCSMEYLTATLETIV